MAAGSHQRLGDGDVESIGVDGESGGAEDGLIESLHEYGIGAAYAEFAAVGVETAGGLGVVELADAHGGESATAQEVDCASPRVGQRAGPDH